MITVISLSMYYLCDTSMWYRQIYLSVDSRNFYDWVKSISNWRLLRSIVNKSGQICATACPPKSGTGTHLIVVEEDFPRRTVSTFTNPHTRITVIYYHSTDLKCTKMSIWLPGHVQLYLFIYSTPSLKWFVYWSTNLTKNRFIFSASPRSSQHI